MNFIVRSATLNDGSLRGGTKKMLKGTIANPKP